MGILNSTHLSIPRTRPLCVPPALTSPVSTFGAHAAALRLSTDVRRGAHLHLWVIEYDAPTCAFKSIAEDSPEVGELSGWPMCGI